MKIKFKKDTENNVETLLAQLHKFKTLFNSDIKSDELMFSSDRNKVSFSAGEYKTITSLLFKSIIQFDVSISEFSKKHILKTVINRVAIENISLSKDFLKLLNDEYDNYYRSKKTTKFYLLTTLSVESLPFTELKLNDKVTISFHDQFPEKFQTSRATLYDKINSKTEGNEWLKVVISIQERDYRDAFEKAYFELETLRALLCLQTISHTIYSSIPSTINKIMLGDFCTMHNDEGNCCNENVYWYELIERNIDLFKIQKEDFENIGKSTKNWLEQLHQCKPSHSKTIKTALNQYVSAFDLVNKESCFLKAWTVLENLLDSHQYDQIVKRCTIGYKNPEYPKLGIELLKTFRNELVHEVKSSNVDDSEILEYCYILEKFIYQHFIGNLSYAGKFASISDYAKYLDYLVDKEKLTKLDEEFKKYKI